MDTKWILGFVVLAMAVVGFPGAALAQVDSGDGAEATQLLPEPPSVDLEEPSLRGPITMTLSGWTAAAAFGITAMIGSSGSGCEPDCHDGMTGDVIAITSLAATAGAVGIIGVSWWITRHIRRSRAEHRRVALSPQGLMLKW